MSVPTQPLPDVEAEFQRQAEAVFDAWLANQLSLQETLKQLEALRQNALSTSNRINEAFIYNTLGIISGYRANYEEAISYCSKAWDIFNTAGARRWVAACDLNMGEAYRLQANYVKARQYFHNAFETGKAMNSMAIQVNAITNEGQMWFSLKSYAKAKETLMEALLLCLAWLPEREHEVTARMDNLGEVYYALAALWLEEKHSKNAWENAKQALYYAKQLERPLRLAYANLVMGDVITLLGTAPEAGYSDDPDTYYQAALEAFKQIKAEGDVAKTLFAQGQSLAKRNKNRLAAQKYQQALLIFTKLGMTDDAAKTAMAQMSLI